MYYYKKKIVAPPYKLKILGPFEVIFYFVVLNS